MNDELHGHLDGDLPLDELPTGAQKEALAWDRLLGAFRVGGLNPKAPPWLETRVMAEIEALPEPGALRRFAAWIASPREVRISPLMGGLAMAAVATVLFFNGPREGSQPLDPVPVGNPAAPAGLAAGAADVTIYVQFALEAPGASSVAVGGDFDGWEGSHVLTDPDGDGVWTGRVAVRPGLHAYMFLVDDSSWVTDPRADRYAEDGFGNRNALLAVTAPSA